LAAVQLGTGKVRYDRSVVAFCPDTLMEVPLLLKNETVTNVALAGML
jgi:hypothetical protein